MSFKVWDALEVSMTASTDVSLHPGNGEDADILIRTRPCHAPKQTLERQSGMSEGAMHWRELEQIFPRIMLTKYGGT